MKWKAHFLIGAFLGFSVFSLGLGKGMAGSLAYALLAGTFALLPDLDLRKSKASQLLYIAALAASIAAAALFYSASLASAIGAFFAIAAGLFAFDLLARPRHRGMMHSPAFALLPFAACLAFFGFEAGLAFAMGYLSHLLADRIS